MKSFLTAAKVAWLAYWPLLAWFIFGKFLGLSNIEAFLLAGLAWTLAGYERLSRKVKALERRPPPPGLL